MDEPDWNEAHFALAQEHGVPDGWCKRCGPWWEYDIGEDDPPPDGPCDCRDRILFSETDESAGGTSSDSADKDQRHTSSASERRPPMAEPKFPTLREATTDDLSRRFVLQMENQDTRTLFDIEVAIRKPLGTKQSRTTMETRVDDHKFGERWIEVHQIHMWVDGLLALGAEEVSA